MRECCEELFLTFFYSFKNMYSRGEASNREGGEESSLMLQAMQQQFECMNVVFNEIRDRMDRQDIVIATLHEEHLQRVLMLEGKKGVCAWMILMMTTRMSSKMKRIKLH